MYKPTEKEYMPFYKGYIGLLSDQVLLDQLKDSTAATLEVLESITEDRGAYAYAPGKWTIKQLLQHLMDTEQIMLYRALRIWRGDKTPMPGFDEDSYVENCHLEHYSFGDLVEDYRLQRAYTLRFFARCTEEESMYMGTCNEGPCSLRALAGIIIGHERHHLAVVKQRYLNS